MSPAAPLPAFPSAYLGRRFVSDDGRLYFVVRPAEAAERPAPGFPLVVEVGRPDGTARYLSEAPARWLPRADEDAAEAHRRLDRVQVELGVANVGETYTLMFTRPTDDRARWHGYDHVALRADTPLDAVSVFPEHGGTPYGAEDWDWQSGWWYPYATFRAAGQSALPSDDNRG